MSYDEPPKTPAKRKRGPRGPETYRAARRNQQFGRRPRGEGKPSLEERRLIRMGLPWRDAKLIYEQAREIAGTEPSRRDQVKAAKNLELMREVSSGAH